MRANSLSPPTACTSGASLRIERLIASQLGAGIAALRSCAQAMQDPATRRDPEIIHQARVAVRGMRAALRVFDAQLRRSEAQPCLRRARKALRRIGRALGEARDWDVVQGSLLPAQRAGLARAVGDAALLRVVRRAQLARARANTTARRFVAGDEFEAALERVDALQRVLVHPGAAGDAAAVRRALARQNAAVLRLGARLALLGRRGRHTLRIEVKRLRYAVELCAPLFAGRGRKQWMNELKGLQAVLGTIIDARVLADRVGPLGDDPALAQHLKAIARHCVREQLPQAAALFMAWRLARPPWKT